MSVPELPAFDASSYSKRIYENIRKPDGSGYQALAPAGPKSFTAFVQGLRTQQDNLARHDVQLVDHKGDLDRHSEEIASLKRRVAELEALPTARPFP